MSEQKNANDPVDLSTSTDIHLIAIGGAGMAAIAEVLHEMGHSVRGSDMNPSAAVDRLQSLGIDAVVGHSVENIDNPAIAMKSTAVPSSNVEVQELQRRGVRVRHRGEVLAGIAALRKTVAVAGTHGKTTTTSMLAVICEQAAIEPSYIIGGVVPDLGRGARWGSGDWFVLEADESDGSGFGLGHTVSIVTNVERDHLEFYGTEENLQAAFAEFVAASRVSVVCLDDPGAARLAYGSNVVTYGLSPDATYWMDRVERQRGSVSFDLHRAGVMMGTISVPMPGLHNALNAAAATAAAMEMGLPFPTAQSALSQFSGVRRRFDSRGETAGVTFVDDYAHLPTEVKAAVAAGVDTGHDRLVVVFQPHRYSRTESVWEEFEGAFDGADLLILTSIYSSGEKPRPGITGELIVQAVERAADHPEIIYHHDRDTLPEILVDILRSGDLCLTLGAGDLVDVPDQVQPLLGTQNATDRDVPR